MLTPRRYAVDNAWTDTPLPEVLDGAVEQLEQAPSAQSRLVAVRFPSSFRPSDATAFSMIRNCLIFHYTVWDGEEQDAANTAWHNDTFRRLEMPQSRDFARFAETDIVRTPDQVARCYSQEAWQRLQALRATHDPDGVFFGHHGVV